MVHVSLSIVNQC